MTSPRSLPVIPSDFIGLSGTVHLAAAGETPALAVLPGVVAKYAESKARGLAGIREIYAEVELARAEVALLLGVTTTEVGFPVNVAQAMGAIARPYDGKGGNVVMTQWEFTSAMSPWITGTDLEVRLLRDPSRLVDTDRLAELVDNDTKAIVISLVSYYSGERVDLEALRSVADRVGAVLVIDASHALGAVDFDATLADFVISCSYKWLLGIHGGAVAYCNAERQPGWLPRETGWRSAVEVPTIERNENVERRSDGSRFELGNPAILGVLMTGQGAGYLNRIGMPAVDSYLVSLTGQLLDGIAGLDLQVLTPADAARRAGIVSFVVEDSNAWQARLQERGVLVWATEGRVRMSPHIYTSSDDIDLALAAIHELSEGTGART